MAMAAQRSPLVVASGSEDDAMSSVSGRQADSRRPSVIGLRDKLLREARNERQRCLEIAEAAEQRRTELRGCCSVAMQTEPVFLLDAPVDSAAPGALLGGKPCWSKSDDEAQAEALRNIQMLGARGHHSRHAEGRLAQLEEELRVERVARQELEVHLSNEQTRTKQAQEQVLCLEYELDGKEAALQVAEKALERRDRDLAQAQFQARCAQDSYHEPMYAGSLDTTYELEAENRNLRSMLQECDQTIEQKDQHINRLLSALRQQNRNNGIVLEEDSTMCGSENSIPVSMSTVTTTAGYGNLPLGYHGLRVR
jgi:hypothetical protein